MTKKKTAKKTTRKTAAQEYPEAPPANIPEGMKTLGSSYAKTWEPDVGDSIHGTVTGGVRSVDMPKRGRMAATTRRVIEVTDVDTEARVAVWESAALGELFDTLDGRENNGEGVAIFLQFDGFGKKKPGQNPPKLYTVALAA